MTGTEDKYVTHVTETLGTGLVPAGSCLGLRNLVVTSLRLIVLAAFGTGVAHSQTSCDPAAVAAQAASSAQAAAQSTGTGTGDSQPTGTKLWCYECHEIYKTKYNPLNAPCKNNLSQIAIRQCGPRDNYCQVHTLQLTRELIEIERGCTELCLYGCRFNGYGLTYRRCHSCCRGYACNTGNLAPDSPSRPSGTVLAVAAFVSTLLTCHSFV